MTIRAPLPQETETIIRVAESTGVFTSVELDAVRELLEVFFRPGPPKDYEFIVYCHDTDSAIVGFACFGPVPLTDRVWDLYWLCVDRQQQGAGIGGKLIRQAEDELRARGARVVYLETSDSPAYQPARNLYVRDHYECVAHFTDFYKPGEGKVIYRKVFSAV